MKSMKLLSVVVLLAILAVLTGCRTSQSNIDKRQIPSFYLNPPKSNETLYGVGHAKMATLDLSRTTALARARDDIAGQVRVSVKSALTDYAQQAGQLDNQQTLQFVETVSRQIADVTLHGCRTDQVEVTDDGSVYALVSYPVNNVVETARAQFIRNEAAAFAEFKADEALRRLNNEIQNESKR